MTEAPVVRTERLRLRGLRPKDLAAATGGAGRSGVRLRAGRPAPDRRGGPHENDPSRKVLHKLGLRHERDGTFYGAVASLLSVDGPPA